MGTSSMPVDSKKIGTFTDLGGRATQQDAVLILPDFLVVQNTVIHIFGIFDGHGSEGHKASAAAKAAFPTIFQQQSEQLLTNTQEVLKSAFKKVDEMLLNDQTWDSYLSGTTAVILVIINNLVYVAHVGDSRLTIIKKADSALIGLTTTKDHTCEVQSEKERIMAAGGRVEQLWLDGKFAGPLRVFKGSLPYPGIAVTRTLGDAAARKIGVLSDPDVNVIELGENDKYLLLATDGLWDGLNMEEMLKCIRVNETPDQISHRLIKAGLKGLRAKQIDDNITNVVIGLNNGLVV
ncbi:phosphatase 2C-like domain-containing protein [Globomyces pollinis-pini]|nr:phosphatase 2C-like domain-containing protein [Globomyces pollinis-pini]